MLLKLKRNGLTKQVIECDDAKRSGQFLEAWQDDVKHWVNLGAWDSVEVVLE